MYYINSNDKLYWITWESQRRNKGLAHYFGMELVELIYDKKNTLYRYIVSTYKTTLLLVKNKPKMVCVQNPSLVLAVLAVFIKYISKYKLIVDAHNSGIFPKNGRSFILNCLSFYIQRKADLVLVTNEYLKNVVEENKGTAFVLPDKLPEVPDTIRKRFKTNSSKLAVFVCTFALDEPYNEVVESACRLDTNITIMITGNYEGKINPDREKTNVIFTGFLPDNEYWDLLKDADVVMDLTTRENCLVCGAYEAIALNKPLILSNTRINREYFFSGCIYVDPFPESIALGINYAFKNLNTLELEIKKLREVLEDNWIKYISSISMHLDDFLTEYANK